MNDIIDSLQRIGLSCKEAQIYVALLKIGDATVKDIAAEAGIKRPTTYLILEDLRQKGLILKIPHIKKAIYRSKNTDELFGYASDNMSALKRALPKLEALQVERNPMKTFYFEGIGGLKDALFYKIDSLENKNLKGFWAKADKISEPVANLFIKFQSFIKNRNVTVEGITVDDSSIEKYRENYEPELYKISSASASDYSSEISIEITDEFVRIIDPIEIKAVIIENKRVADTLKQIVELAKKGLS